MLDEKEGVNGEQNITLSGIEPGSLSVQFPIRSRPAYLCALLHEMER